LVAKGLTFVLKSGLATVQDKKALLKVSTNLHTTTLPFIRALWGHVRALPSLNKYRGLRRLRLHGINSVLCDETSTREFIRALTSCTRTTTPYLEDFMFTGPLLAFVDAEGNDLSWLELLLGEHQGWEAETEALRRWWVEERPLGLRLLKVGSKLDLRRGVPKLLSSNNPHLVQLGVLLSGSLGKKLQGQDMKEQCVQALIDQLEEKHPLPLRVQAVCAITAYVSGPGQYDYLDPQYYAKNHTWPWPLQGWEEERATIQMTG
jgi:hypothetical protein